MIHNMKKTHLVTISKDFTEKNRNSFYSIEKIPSRKAKMMLNVVKKWNIA